MPLMKDDLLMYEKELVWKELLLIRFGGDIYQIVSDNFTDDDFMHLLNLLLTHRYVFLKNDDTVSYKLTIKGEMLLDELNKELRKKGLYKYMLPSNRGIENPSRCSEDIYIPSKETIKRMQKERTY